MNSIYYDTDIIIVPESNLEKLNSSELTELLVLCRAEDYSENKDLLINILKAISFVDGENATIVRLENEETIHLAKRIDEQIKYVLCFGLSPKSISINAGFQSNRFYKTESFSIMLSHSLSQLQANKNNKLSLWGALQKAFKS